MVGLDPPKNHQAKPRFRPQDLNLDPDLKVTQLEFEQH